MLLVQRPTERPIALAADSKEKTYWIYTSASLLEVRIAQEDRDVWRIHLHRQNHDLALQFAKVYAVFEPYAASKLMLDVVTLM
jgi:hypothetical protein